MDPPRPRNPGLTEAEASRRLAARPAVKRPATSRSYASIVASNVFTVFNVILATFGGLTLAFGHAEDALFLGILVANASIGIVQEIRAKRTLDHLAALVAPTAVVVRDGRDRRVAVNQVATGDLVRVQAGDSVVADGNVEVGDGWMVDESVLTGESQPVARPLGSEVRSGSFMVEGTGTYVVSAVGAASYAERIARQATTFRTRRSPLERSLNQLLLILAGVMVPLGIVFGFSLRARHVDLGDAVTTAVAAIVPLVPEGLIVLTRLTYAVGVLRMARHRVLAQKLNALESLASIDVVCVDKTGTLTEPALRLVEVIPAPGVEADTIGDSLGRFAANSPTTNATVAGIAERFPGVKEPVTEHVPFTSRRRWSGLRMDGRTYVLGAPELFPVGGLADRVTEETRQGRRVVAIAAGDVPFDGVPEEPRLPEGLALLALVSFTEQLRPEAAPTVEYLLREGVRVKVLSGDAPETVAAIARDVGIPCPAGPIDGRSLPSDPAALSRIALDADVIGRVAPDDKRRLVESLQNAGYRVAMVGDGVNDVPALKAAHLAIAQGSGSQMAKGVADLVLVASNWDAVPALVVEGRRILRNLKRVTKLFVTKSAFAAFVILTVGLTPESYPFLARHLTLAGTLTIGVPAFFLALAPSSGPWRESGFLREVARFAVPAGTAAGLAVVSSYLFGRNVMRLPLLEARTIAVTALLLVGLYLIVVLEASGPVRMAAVCALCVVLLALYGAVIAVPASREFFDLAIPRTASLVVAGSAASVAVLALAFVDDRFLPRTG